MPETLTKSANPKQSDASPDRQTSAGNFVQTRILLALWTMNRATRSELKASLIRKREKETAVLYTQRLEKFQEIVDRLEQGGAIASADNKLSLSAMGLQLLDQGLTHPEFIFDAQIGAKTANALLKWMQYKLVAISVSVISAANGTVNGSGKSQAIASYDEFKTVALEVFDRLNRDYNLDNLVPIYRIRRELGDRVSRAEFNEWLLEMQAQDIWQLIGGEMPDITPDKAEDSIKTALGGARYYARHL